MKDQHAKPQSEKAWNGVFTENTDTRFELFSESVSYDKRLFEHDIRASIAHARMLSEVDVLTKEEFAAIEEGLVTIRREIENGDFDFRIQREDVHMNIEAALIEKIGDTGRKLHTGRSRNDQISTDMKLWVRDAIDRIDFRLASIQRAFVERSENDFDVIIPAYTHMQRAQPVLASHYWLAYVEKFQRDRDRLTDCRRRVNSLSLGGAAVAGTSIPIDRRKTAAFLEFDLVSANSVDISSDRDFMIEFAFDLAQIALHLSTWAEEWIIWSTSEFNFLRLPQSFCTGSSIMPQKINPDVLELIRGKTARVVGNLQTLLVLTKGLPLAYNRDLQEDKEPVFDSCDTVDASLELAAPLILGTKINGDVISTGLDRGYLDATTLMEHLILKGVPQRTAHGIVGKLVRLAMNANMPLAGLPITTFREVHDGFDETVFEILGARQCVDAMKSLGSTAPQFVKEQIAHWKTRLDADSHASSSAETG